MSEALNEKPTVTPSPETGSIGSQIVQIVMDKATDVLSKMFAPNTQNITTNGTNETEKFKPTTEGLFLAYTSLVVMALIPIIIGSFKSVKHQKKQQVIPKFYTTDY